MSGPPRPQEERECTKREQGIRKHQKYREAAAVDVPRSNVLLQGRRSGGLTLSAEVKRSWGEVSKALFSMTHPEEATRIGE
jgi:hypothetical protein